MNIFIGCASKNNIPNKYKEDCKEYLIELLKDNNLVFGADNTGLMGLSHDIAISNNREIIGVCPKRFNTDFKNLNCSKEIETNTTIERINEIIKLSDALVFLPGGFGTLAELFSAIDSKRCHEFDKPIIIYNSNNYYDKILIALEKIFEENFSSSNIVDMYHISPNSKDTLEYIEKYYSESKTKTVKVRTK